MQRAMAFEEPEEKVREYLEVGAMWENQVQERDKGTPAYEAILEIDPTHDQAFLSLEQLHGEAKRAEPLIELYLARLDTRDAIPEKTEILRKVAGVFEEELDDKPQAFDACLTAFEMDFEDMDTVRYLERMSQATNRWPELVQTVNGWLQAQTEAQPKITALPAVGQVVRGGSRPSRVRSALLPTDPQARPQQRRGASPDGELLQEDRSLARAGADAHAGPQ